MSARNRGLALLPAPPKPGFSHRDPPPQFGRALAPRPHPALLDEHRGPHLPRHHPGHDRDLIIQDRLAAQHHEIQGLLVDNQGLAATHVALRQELEIAQHEIGRVANALGSARAEADFQLRERYEKLMKMESDLCATDAMKAELAKVRADIHQLSGERQELSGRVQALTHDLDRAGAELRRLPALKGEIETVRQQLQQARAAIEYEKKGYAENYERGLAMEKNLASMSREMEKLRAELCNAEKRKFAAAAAGSGNPGFEVTRLVITRRIPDYEGTWDTLEEGVNNWQVLFTSGDDYIDTAEYDVFGQFAENVNALVGRPPASISFVQNLPSVVVTQEDVDKSNASCTVCKDDLRVGELAKQLPCLHQYHGECVMRWLGIRNTCPICRYELPTDDPEYERIKRQRDAART